jgi:adenylate kinase family enzyme
MDGGFITHSRARFERADTVVWIELPIWRCLARAMWRMLTHFGRARADLAPGCPERFDLAFYRYIWNWDRDTRPRMQAAIEAWSPGARLIRLKSDRDMRRFIADPFVPK